MYPTLSSSFSSGTSVDIVLFSLHLVGLSSIIGSINFVTTVYRVRSVVYHIGHSRVLVFGLISTALLLILCVPVLAGAITILITDRNCYTCFFDTTGGGDPVVFQHLF